MTKAKKFMALCSKQKALPCRTPETMELFFINPGNEEADTVYDAKALCAQCPILMECRAEGFRIMDKWAVMGGLTPVDRAVVMAEQEQTEGLELAA